jgi:hypothetical protein
MTPSTRCAKIHQRTDKEEQKTLLAVSLRTDTAAEQDTCDISRTAIKTLLGAEDGVIAVEIMSVTFNDFFFALLLLSFSIATKKNSRTKDMYQYCIEEHLFSLYSFLQPLLMRYW